MIYGAPMKGFLSLDKNLLISWYPFPLSSFFGMLFHYVLYVYVFCASNIYVKHFFITRLGSDGLVTY